MTDSLSSSFAPAKRATAERVACQNRLFSDTWFFGQLMNYVPDMVLVLNEERQVVYANQALLTRVSAADLKSVLGKRPGEIFRCKHAKEGNGGCGTTESCRYCGALDATLQSQAGKAAVEECRMTVRGATGEESLDLRVWATPIQASGERFTFFAVTNIGDEKRRRFLERVFLHDLTNTATALRGFSWLLADEFSNPAAGRGYLEQIGRLTDRMLTEIEAQKQLVAAENGELKVEIARISSMAVIRELFEIYDRPEAFNHRRIRVAKGSEDVVFESDLSLLQRVLGNMVKNAMEAAVPGETVTLGCNRESAGVAFRVHNPTYMPKDVRLQVFNRSFSTKGPGRGLGTYSMKFLTENYLGGTISFTSSEAEGTTFCARYPEKFAGKKQTAASG